DGAEAPQRLTGWPMAHGRGPIDDHRSSAVAHLASLVRHLPSTIGHQSRPILLLPAPRRSAPIPAPVRFELLGVDAGSAARLGVLHTPPGPVETPVFMPVGTQATVKGIVPELLRAAGSRMVLANTSHLALRPGEEVVETLGG